MADLDELKAALEHTVEAYNAGNLEAYAAVWHDDVGLFGIVSPFPVLGRAAVRQYFQRVFAHSEGQTFTVINPQFRVIGTTGVIWSHYALANKPKDGPMQTLFGRATFTFAKSDGRWLMVALHASALPSGS
jgi:uncharacterized protein (TIGR02246 family)